jgi:hypothetical protein
VDIRHPPENFATGNVEQISTALNRLVYSNRDVAAGLVPAISIGMAQRSNVEMDRTSQHKPGHGQVGTATSCCPFYALSPGLS